MPRSVSARSARNASFKCAAGSRYQARNTIVYVPPCARILPCTASATVSEDSTGAYVGVGAGYDFNEHIGIGVNYDLYRADFDTFDMETRALTASLELRF